MNTAYLRFEILRTVRNRRFFFFSLGFPLILYFLVAGQHPDWGYPDQPPMTPILTWVMSRLGGSLPVVRLPSALAAGATVLLAGMTAREMGGGRRAQLIAAACTGVSATTLVTGHFVSTTTYDVLFSAALTWLLARAVRTGENWLLLPAGHALGLGCCAPAGCGPGRRWSSSAARLT